MSEQKIEFNFTFTECCFFLSKYDLRIKDRYVFIFRNEKKVFLPGLLRSQELIFTAFFGRLYKMKSGCLVSGFSKEFG